MPRTPRRATGAATPAAPASPPPQAVTAVPSELPLVPEPRVGRHAVSTAAPHCPDDAHRGAPRAWGLPWHRAWHAQRLWMSFVAGGCDNHMKVGTLLAEASQPETWHEALQIQGAIGERLAQQQRAWTMGVEQITAEYLQLNSANTLSKWVEQEYNIGMQMGALCFNQLVNMTALAENVQVDLAYWLSLRKEGA